MTGARGFTLIESLIGALLLATIFFAVFGLYPSSLNTLRQAHDLTSASNLGQQALEAARAQQFSQVAVGTQAMTPAPVLNGTTFNVTTTVTSLGDNEKDVAVTVTWSMAPLDRQSHLNYDTHVFNYLNP